MSRYALGIAAVSLLLVAGCHAKPVTYKANVRLERFDVVSTDAKGQPERGDAELVWHECPGASREVIRGDAAWTACMLAKHKVGDVVAVTIDWHWNDAGRYDWDITDTGGCARPPLAGDESSFDTVQECTELRRHGAVIGFSCNRLPQADLIQKCPWFRRH
jgi:hypothetical protein